MLKCKHCGIEMDNPMIFHIHQANCLEVQKQNGLIQNANIIDYASMTVEQLKNICKENDLEGYTVLNKDDLIKFMQKNIK